MQWFLDMLCVFVAYASMFAMCSLGFVAYASLFCNFLSISRSHLHYYNVLVQMLLLFWRMGQCKMLVMGEYRGVTVFFKEKVHNFFSFHIL